MESTQVSPRELPNPLLDGSLFFPVFGSLLNPAPLPADSRRLRLRRLLRLPLRRRQRGPRRAPSPGLYRAFLHAYTTTAAAAAVPQTRHVAEIRSRGSCRITGGSSGRGSGSGSSLRVFLLLRTGPPGRLVSVHGIRAKLRDRSTAKFTRVDLDRGGCVFPPGERGSMGHGSSVGIQQTQKQSI